MDVFLMIRRKKMTLFLDAKENTTVLELKRMIEGITKKPPTEQRLYNKEDTVSWTIYFTFQIWHTDPQMLTFLSKDQFFGHFEK